MWGLILSGELQKKDSLVRVGHFHGDITAPSPAAVGRGSENPASNGTWLERERERACLPHLAVFSIRTTITIRVTGTPRLASHAASRGVTRRHSPSCVSSGLVSEKAWSETTRGDVKGPGAQNPLGEAHPALVHEPETSSELLDGTGVSL